MTRPDPYELPPTLILLEPLGRGGVATKHWTIISPDIADETGQGSHAATQESAVVATPSGRRLF